MSSTLSSRRLSGAAAASSTMPRDRAGIASGSELWRLRRVSRWWGGSGDADCPGQRDVVVHVAQLCGAVNHLAAGERDRGAGLVMEHEALLEPRLLGRICTVAARREPVVPQPVDVRVVEPEDRVARG